jgi:hypothetical protein
VENLAESPWMCSDGSGSAPIEIPKEGVLLSPRARKRDGEEVLCKLGTSGSGC